MELCDRMVASVGLQTCAISGIWWLQRAGVDFVNARDAPAAESSGTGSRPTPVPGSAIASFVAVTLTGVSLDHDVVVANKPAPLFRLGPHETITIRTTDRPDVEVGLAEYLPDVRICQRLSRLSRLSRCDPKYALDGIFHRGYI